MVASRRSARLSNPGSKRCVAAKDNCSVTRDRQSSLFGRPQDYESNGLRDCFGATHAPTKNQIATHRNAMKAHVWDIAFLRLRPINIPVFAIALLGQLR